MKLEALWEVNSSMPVCCLSVSAFAASASAANASAASMLAASVSLRCQQVGYDCVSCPSEIDSKVILMGHEIVKLL